MEETIIFQITSLALGTLGAWLLKKGYMVFGPLKAAFDLAEEYVKASKDKKFSKNEKIVLFDKQCKLIEESYLYAKGISFWKSKK